MIQGYEQLSSNCSSSIANGCIMKQKSISIGGSLAMIEAILYVEGRTKEEFEEAKETVRVT